MGKNDGLSDTELEWLVGARNEIQNSMLQMYSLRPSLQEDSSKEYRRIWNLLVGTAFSLWRAVFLVYPIDETRDPDELQLNAEKYLKKVVETNALLFTDDRAMKIWSAGYYLNNARYRLKIICGSFQEAKLKEHISNVPLNEVWEETHKSMLGVLQNLDQYDK